MDSKVLQDRLNELEWTTYRLAQEYDRVKGENKGANNYASTVKKALANPDESKGKTLEDLVKALRGKIVIRWEQLEEVVVDYKEVDFTK
ncbi:MAG: hypothetical protein F6K24_56885 [Okeania sp. SIO2D1]|nr:hypothetical protein [Okeania sp. SIO2D1]